MDAYQKQESNGRSKSTDEQVVVIQNNISWSRTWILPFELKALLLCELEAVFLEVLQALFSEFICLE